MTVALLIVVTLAAGGLVLIAVNLRRLILDWPRLKPVYNVDLAWVQVYFGLVLWLVAWFVATDPAHKLINESTRVYTAEQAAAAQASASSGQGASTPATK